MPKSVIAVAIVPFGLDIAAAHLSLDRRRHRPGHAVDGQLTWQAQADHLPRLEPGRDREGISLEGRLRELLDGERLADDAVPLADIEAEHLVDAVQRGEVDDDARCCRLERACRAGDGEVPGDGGRFGDSLVARGLSGELLAHVVAGN